MHMGEEETRQDAAAAAVILCVFMICPLFIQCLSVSHLHIKLD